MLKVVIFRDGSEVTKRLVDDRPLRIGRSADNDIVLPDHRVSGHHAEIARGSGSDWRYVDSSSNGTYRDGARIESVTLDRPVVLDLVPYRVEISPVGLEDGVEATVGFDGLIEPESSPPGPSLAPPQDGDLASTVVDGEKVSEAESLEGENPPAILPVSPPAEPKAPRAAPGPLLRHRKVPVVRVRIDAGLQAGSSVLLRHFPATIGRLEDCHFRVLDPTVSRRHAEIRVDGGGMTMVNLSEDNRVVAGGVSIRSGESARIGFVSTVELGSVRLQLEWSEAEDRRGSRPESRVIPAGRLAEAEKAIRFVPDGSNPRTGKVLLSGRLDATTSLRIQQVFESALAADRRGFLLDGRSVVDAGPSAVATLAHCILEVERNLGVVEVGDLGTPLRNAASAAGIEEFFRQRAASPGADLSRSIRS